MVYFAVIDGTDFVKIGWGANPADRLRKIQANNPHRCSIVAALPGKAIEERRLHAQFAEYRVRASHEWFVVRGRLKAFLDELRTTSPYVACASATRAPTATRKR